MADHQQLKDQAIAYYKENRVPMRMQDVLNLMFQVNPLDVNGYVSNYFEELAVVPTITKILAVKALDSKGQPSITTKLYCLVRNDERLVGDSHVCIDTELMDNAKTEEKEAEDVAREQEIDDAISLINNDFRDIIISANPRCQLDLDQKLYAFVESRRLEFQQKENENKEAEAETPQPATDDGKKGAKKSGKSSAKKKAQVAVIPDKPKEKAYPGWTSVTVLSQSLCVASAALARTSVFEHLLSCYGVDANSVRLPLPVITLIQSGKAALGKNNCIKEYMIVPRPDMPMSEAIPAAVKFQEAILKLLYAKGGVAVKNVSDFGALCPLIDKPEQGLDMISEVVSQQGFEMGTDFFFVLNASAQECFDYEKGKYEVVSGLAKSGDDMADFWADLSTRYPAIIGIIDPVRSEEKEQWNKVCSSISERCLVMADKAYDRPGLLINQDLNFFEFATSGTVLRLQNCNTVTHVVESAKKMSDMDNIIMLAGGQHEANNTTIIDVAIASRARFIKLGAPNRGERISKFNKLIELESELGEREAKWEALEFPLIPPTPPTPTPETEEIITAEE